MAVFVGRIINYNIIYKPIVFDFKQPFTGIHIGFIKKTFSFLDIPQFRDYNRIENASVRALKIRKGLKEKTSTFTHIKLHKKTFSVKFRNKLNLVNLFNLKNIIIPTFLIFHFIKIEACGEFGLDVLEIWRCSFLGHSGRAVESNPAAFTVKMTHLRIDFK